MSNLRDSLSDKNVDISRPSTSQTATQSLRPKCGLTSKIKENKTNPSKKSQKHRNMSRPKQPQDDTNIPTRTFLNSMMSDVTTQCQNLNINCESDDVDQGDSSGHHKKKNARKKEKQKRLHVQIPAPHQLAEQQNNLPQSSAENVPVAPYETTSVQELFTNQIGPLYANASTRYLENLYHHPQYQYLKMQMAHNNQYHMPSASAPNTPFLNTAYFSNNQPHMQSMQRPYSANIPVSPMNDPSFPKFVQNVIYHPLLNRTFSMENYSSHDQQQVPNNVNALTNATQHLPATQNGTPSKKRTRKRTDTEGMKFDKYITKEEAEQGLKDNSLIEGVLRINPKQFQHSYVSSSTDRSEQDVLIDGIKNRNRALEGDIVIVQLLNDSDSEDNSEDKQKKGKVVHIKDEVHNRTCIGSLKLMPDKNRQRALFIPRDHRIPRLNIPFTCWPNNFYQNAQNYENTLFLAKIVEWFDTRFAVGKIVDQIGQSGDMLCETKAILAQTDLDVRPFGSEVRHLYPRLDYTIPEEELSIREDCRKLCIFSIDPFNCRDIDDAMSCRELENGNYEIGVHISDVAHFLNENTILDEKVAEKATTIYMVERAYHMLPDELCMLCSLFPGVDKLAFSVFWEITKDAEVLSHRFSKTVIHSCSQLAYEHAQAVLEDHEDAESKFPETYNGFQFKDIQKSIKILGKIAATFRKNRFEGGALRIDQPKVSFSLDIASGLPESFCIYESRESHQLIEEFMLLANMTVAKKIYEDHPKLAFLRCHPAPSGYMLKQLAKSLAPMGIELDIESAGALHRSLQLHVGPECENRGKAMVLNMLCAKPMTRAKYFCADGQDDDEFCHYALNVDLYTHFTSPIRRYADIMVHRLLAASLKCRPIPQWDVDKVRMIAAQCNKQKYNAKRAGELSTELYTLKYIEMHSPVITEAVVVEVREKYIDVIIASMSLNRRIFFNNDFPGEYKCIKNERGMKLSKMEILWKATDTKPQVKQVIEVFSLLQVEMHREDELVKVETKLVRPN